MRFLQVILLVMLLVPPVMGVGSQDADLGRNALRDNPNLSLYSETETGQTQYVEGRLADNIALGEELQATLGFLNDHRGAFKIAAPEQELAVRRIDIDNLGMRHLRLTQKYEGLTVIGGEVISHVTAEGVLKTVNGNFHTGINLDVTPALQSAAATEIALTDLETFFGTGDPDSPELVIFPWEGNNFLAWRTFIRSSTPMGRWEYFVDAKTGEVIFKANRIMDVAAIGTGTSVMGDTRNHIDTDDNGSTFRMIDNTRQITSDPHGHDGRMPFGNVIQTYESTTSLPGSLATDADNTWTASSQAPSVDGHVYTALVYDYMNHVLDRNGYDDNGSSMYTSVNYSAEGDNNAYWNGARIVIWSYSSGWRSLAGCPDVIAHEWGHAITETTSNLVYQKEPGALNESFSDMIGAAFEFAHDTLDTPDWYMGENGIIGGTGFRSMSDPHSKGDPDTYGTSDPYWVDVEGCSPAYNNDYCGVHTNSGVGNKWFYLLSDGDTHNSVTVTGIGVENAIQVAYRANAFYWNSQSTYSDAAMGTISAANDLDPSGIWATQVIDAWNAVQVDLPTPSIAFAYPSGIPSSLTPGETTTFDVVVNATLGGSTVSGSGQLHYSIDGGAYTAVSMTEVTADNYEATLPALACGERIDFYVSAAEATYGVFNDPDPVTPNTAKPTTNEALVWQDDFETFQSWSATGAWSRGTPTGGGGAYGGPDPSSAYSGTTIYGYNLTGDYSNDLPERPLTSPAIDCSGFINTRLKFQRWLGVEQPAYDHAYIRVSNNGTTWVTVWENETEIADTEWIQMDIDISAVADSQATVYLRWVMGTTDGGWTYCGWNIDDIEVYGSQCFDDELTILTTTLPDWTEGVPYSQQLDAVGQVGEVTWVDKYADLISTGLSLSTSGLVTGIPTMSGTLSFTAEASDEFPNVAEQPLSIVLNPTLEIVDSTLPDGVLGEGYSFQLTGTGGTGTVVWSDKFDVLSGSGLTLTALGLISGTPVSGGDIDLTVTIQDDVGGSVDKLLSFEVIVPCCVGLVGNINCDPSDVIDISDIQALVDNLFLTLTPLCCYEEANVDFLGVVDVSDLQILIDNQFLTLTPMQPCP